MNQTTTSVRRGRQVETVTITQINPTEYNDFTFVAVEQIERLYDGETTEVIYWGLTESGQHISLNARQHARLCL